MKKTWALSLVLVIVAIVGFACGGDAATPTTSPTATSPAPTATSPVMVEPTATSPVMVEPTATSPTMVEPTATTAAATDDHDDVALGQQLVASYGCLGCHTTDGSALVGPSWKGLYGSVRELADGSSVTADEAYIEESIGNPSAKIAQGFAPIMPPFNLSDDDLHAVVEFIKSLN